MPELGGVREHKRDRPGVFTTAQRVTPDHTRRSVAHTTAETTFLVIILGLILLVIGFVAHISILWTIGIILLVIGIILALLGATGRAVGGRRHWF